LALFTYVEARSMSKYAACTSKPLVGSILMPASRCSLAVAGSCAPELMAVDGAPGVDSRPSMKVP
jgi:hypothetical protein